MNQQGEPRIIHYGHTWPAGRLRNVHGRSNGFDIIAFFRRIWLCDITKRHNDINEIGGGWCIDCGLNWRTI